MTILEQTDVRRLTALTVTLSRRGLLPAFYATPKDQIDLQRRLRRQLGSVLGTVGAVLVSLLDDGDIDPQNEFQVNGALSADAERVSNGVQGAFLASYQEAARLSFLRQAQVILDLAGVGLSWEAAEPRVIRILEDLSFEASKKLMERITGDVKAELVRGVREGLGTRQIADRLRDQVDDLTAHQAEVIARTEVNSALNQGSYLALEEADVEFVQWIAAQDARTRPTHMAQHGMVVRRSERFPNGLRFPGDRTGTDIGEWISCRCAVSAYFPLQSELVLQTPFTGRA